LLKHASLQGGYSLVAVATIAPRGSRAAGGIFSSSTKESLGCVI
jgi:hypothetical protein